MHGRIAVATLLDRALQLAKQGYRVFPLHEIVDGKCGCGKPACRDVGKHPATPHGFKDATTDVEQIRRWWKGSNSGIGIATGKASDLVVLDVDGEKGRETLAKLEAEHGILPDTLMVKSGRVDGGTHHWFRYPAGVEKVKSVNRREFGLDVRADGGYVVAPWSPHVSGKRYKVINGVDVAPCPAMVLSWANGDKRDDIKPQSSNTERPWNREAEKELRSALAVLDADDRDTWVRYGAAIHNLDWAIRGRQVWDQWAAKSSKYDAEDQERVWRSFGNGYGGPPVTVASIYDAAIAKGWRDPIVAAAAETPIETPTEIPWPLLGEAALYGLAGEVVREISPHTEADPLALLLLYLAAFGNAIGRGPYYEVESTRHRANLFGLLVGNSAKGRKGTAQARVNAIMGIADPVWMMERQQQGLSSGEGLIWALRDGEIEFGLTGMEVINGIADKRLYLIEEEFASVLAVMKRPGNTLSPLMRRAFDGGSLALLTKNSNNVATNSHISMAAHITDHELKRELTVTDMANGFANRLLIAMVKRGALLPHGGNLSNRVIEDLGRRTQQALAAGRHEHRLRMTPEAARYWTEIYAVLSAERPGLLGAIVARAEAHTIRLALVYALLDRSKSIKSVHIKAAQALWECCAASAKYLFGHMLGDPIADDILQALHGAGSAGMTRTDIRDLFKRNRTMEDINMALAMLEKNGLARLHQQEKKTAGRPAECWVAVRL